MTLHIADQHLTLCSSPEATTTSNCEHEQVVRADGKKHGCKEFRITTPTLQILQKRQENDRAIEWVMALSDHLDDYMKDFTTSYSHFVLFLRQRVL